MRSTFKRRKTTMSGIAILMAAGLVLSACGDDDDDDATSGGGPSSAPALTGDPIRLGLSNTENSPAGNYIDSRKGMEAAVRYINEELGGVNGRPIELESCITNATPETGIACANQFVQKDKLAVLDALDLSGAGAMPIYTEAGMPFVGYLTSAPEFTAPIAFSFNGAGAALVAAVGAYPGVTMQAKKVAFVGQDIPQMAALFDTYARPILARAGVTEVNFVTEAATAADFTPAVTKAWEGADALGVFYGEAGCAKVMQAVATLNIPRDKVVYNMECANDETIEAGNGGGDGAIYQSHLLSIDGDSPNAKLFREKIKQYSDAPAGVSTGMAFDTVMNLYNTLKSLEPNDITRETLLSALRASKDEPAFLTEGYTCDGQQFPGAPALCDASSRFWKYEDGKFVETDNQWLNMGELISAGG